MKQDLINELFSEKNWVKEVNSSNNKNCLVMFSGGSDSALCLAILKRLGFNVESIHFMNKWTWKLNTEEAKRISKLLGIKLHIYDITQEFISEIVGKVNGRPCALCKNIMDRKTIDFCLKNDFSWICEGDIAWDGSVNRIKNYESKRGNNNLYVTKYLC